MEYLNVNEVLDVIDKQFGYDFENKDKDDHLISKKTWNKYVREFCKNKINQTQYVKSLENQIIGAYKHTKYREDFVKKVIEFREKQLIKQFNSNRKTTINYARIKAIETIASALDIEVEEDIYNSRIPITQYEKDQEGKYPNITKRHIENIRGDILQTVIEQLIDMPRFNKDVYRYIISTSLNYVISNPSKIIEYKQDNTFKYKIDAKNYLKKEVIKKLTE